MSPRLLSRIALVALAAGCSSDIVAPVSATAAHGVVVSMGVPGRCLFGGCDPAISPPFVLGLGTILNTGTGTVYLRACNTALALREQELVNGSWVDVYPATTCAIGPLSIALAAGDSVQFNSYFHFGTRRMVIGVATTPDLNDEMVAGSASFVAK
jgi:hypothetical protein